MHPPAREHTCFVEGLLPCWARGVCGFFSICTERRHSASDARCRHIVQQWPVRASHSDSTEQKRCSRGRSVLGVSVRSIPIYFQCGQQQWCAAGSAHCARAASARAVGASGISFSCLVLVNLAVHGQTDPVTSDNGKGRLPRAASHVAYLLEQAASFCSVCLKAGSISAQAQHTIVSALERIEKTGRLGACLQRAGSTLGGSPA